MSHSTIRTEKTCLNCGATVEDRYCPQCGQENRPLGESSWHLLVHYFLDLFHYDGKTLHSLRSLVHKPGQVPKEYLEGKRKSNIDPVRFYIFSSTVFFILFFTLVKVDKDVVVVNDIESLRERIHVLNKEKEYLAGTQDTVKVNALIQSLKENLDSLRLVAGDTSRNFNFNVGLDDGTEQDTQNWLYKLFVKRSEERQKEVDEKYRGNTNRALQDLIDEFLHKLPQLIFLTLPFFALFLKLLYITRKRTYVDHLIFSVYQYGYFYTLMIGYVITQWLVDKSGQVFIRYAFDLLISAFIIYMFIYLLLSLKRFYGGRWGLLLLRYLTLLTATLAMILVLGGVIAIITYLM